MKYLSMILFLAAVPATASEIPPLGCPEDGDRLLQSSQITKSTDANGVEHRQRFEFCTGKDGTPRGPARLLNEQADRVVQQGNMAEKKDGVWVEFNGDGSKVSEVVYKKGIIDGPAKLYWPGNNMIKAEFTHFDGKTATGQTTYRDESGNVVASGDFPEAKKAWDEFKSQLENKKIVAVKNARAEQLARTVAAQDEAKKNWESKKVGNVSAFLDKKSKLLWSPSLGQGIKFVTAFLKCQEYAGGGWRLPSASEWSAAFDHGASNALPDMEQLYWSSTDQIHETDPSRSALLGDKGVWTVNANDGSPVVMDRIRDEAGVKCVR